MRVDSHQHFWRYDQNQYAWISDEMSVLKRDFLPVDLLPELHANGIWGCVAVQTSHSEEETRFLVTLAEQHKEVKGVVGWLDLSGPKVQERLHHLSQIQKLRGFRHIVQSEADDRFMLRPEFCRGIGFLKGYGFTFDILIYSHQLPAALELVTRFPDQRFVIDHIAKPSIRSGELSPWSSHMREIARSPNVYCKLSGLVTEADWSNWQAETFRPYLDVVFDAFAPERLMFGSDWPVCLLAASYGQVKALIENYTGQLSVDQRKAIFGLNAIRFYGLGYALDGSTTQR